MGPAGTGFWDFPEFLKTLSFRYSFRRLDSLQTSLQLLFVTDFIPTIAFLVLEAEASCWRRSPPWMYPVDLLGFSSGTTAALTSPLHEGPASVSLFPPGNPDLGKAAGTGSEAPQNRGWTRTGTIPGAVVALSSSPARLLRDDP